MLDRRKNMDDVLNYLAKDVVEKIEYCLPLNIADDMDSFMKSEVSIKKRAEVLELLYLLQLYGNAFVSVDPRGKITLVTCVNFILRAKSNDEVDAYIESLKFAVDKFREAETHPLETIKDMLKQREECKDIIF